VPKRKKYYKKKKNGQAYFVEWDSDTSSDEDDDDNPSMKILRLPMKHSTFRGEFLKKSMRSLRKLTTLSLHKKSKEK
jgi:hypothetical protein